MADSKLTALSEISVPALEDLTYWVDDPSGTPVSDKVTASRMFGLLRGVCGFRLTTESGVPVSTSDRTSQSTLYLTPALGWAFPGQISLYDGTRWKLQNSAEISLSLSSLTSGKNYDVFAYDVSGTLTLELSAAWTNDTTRADALTTQDGVYVKSGATTRRWIGTIRTTGTTATEDSLAKRFVWNAYNRIDRSLYRQETTSHTYGTDTTRYWNNDTTQNLEWVCGLTTPVSVVSTKKLSPGGAWCITYLALDWTSGHPTPGETIGYIEDTATSSKTSDPSVIIQSPVGYHYIAILERGAGTTHSYVSHHTRGKISA